MNHIQLISSCLLGGGVKLEYINIYILIYIYIYIFVLNYQLSQKFKLIERGKFNYLIITLTLPIM
jgi:hypothetical protein